MKKKFLLFIIIASILSIVSSISSKKAQEVSDNPPKPEFQERWIKGAIHTHTLWSDGNMFPETVADMYKKMAYNFVAFSDHDTVHTGDKYVLFKDLPKETIDQNTLRFGQNSIEFINDTEIKLKTTEEYKKMVEENDKFIILEGTEVTNNKIHMLAINVDTKIPSIAENIDTLEVINRNFKSFNEYQKNSTNKSILEFAHPNSQPEITPEIIAAHEGKIFIEIYNGHPLINNDGDTTRLALERLWDMILSLKMEKEGQMVYGFAVDDAHHYYNITRSDAVPGRGWVMVKLNNKLEPNNIVQAIYDGNFYSSTGVELEEINKSDTELRIKINQKTPVSNYKTLFIGTKKGYHFSKTPIYDDGKIVSYTYSDEIGEILKVDTSLNPFYEFTGDELYIRAKVISSDVKNNPKKVGEFEMAWTQPVTP